MVIKQGAIYWYDAGEPRGSEPGYVHPVVVIQNDAVNVTAIGTTLVCFITSNLRLGYAVGNVALRKGEGNLPKKSVVNVSQVLTVDKNSLETQIGTLSKSRVIEIVAGINKLLQPRNF